MLQTLTLSSRVYTLAKLMRGKGSTGQVERFSTFRKMGDRCVSNIRFHLTLEKDFLRCPRAPPGTEPYTKGHSSRHGLTQYSRSFMPSQLPSWFFGRSVLGCCLLQPHSLCLLRLLVEFRYVTLIFVFEYHTSSERIKPLIPLARLPPRKPKRHVYSYIALYETATALATSEPLHIALLRLAKIMRQSSCSHVNGP
jgi:hypothetical protein